MIMDCSLASVWSLLVGFCPDLLILTFGMYLLDDNDSLKFIIFSLLFVFNQKNQE